MRANTPPGQHCQPGEGDAEDGYPERHDCALEPRHPVRQPDVTGLGRFVKQAIDRERTRPPLRRRPLQSHVERAAVLLVLHAELVHSRVQPQRADQRMHVGRRRPPNHQFPVQPDVEAVVARAVQFDFARFGHVPETAPARAEEPARQAGVDVQKVEVDYIADVVAERCTVEADIGKDLPPDACPVRRTRAEDKQQDGQPQGCTEASPGQTAKPPPVEPGKTDSYGHVSIDGNQPVIDIRHDTACRAAFP